MVRQLTQNRRKLTEIIHRLELEKVEAIVRKQGQSRLQEHAAHRWNVNDQALLRIEGSTVRALTKDTDWRCTPTSRAQHQPLCTLDQRPPMHTTGELRLALQSAACRGITSGMQPAARNVHMR